MMKVNNENILITLLNENILNESKPISYIKSYFWWKKIRNIKAIFSNETKKKEIKVLDVGCGRGSTIFYLSTFYSKGFFYKGIDITQSNIFFANERKRIFKKNNLTFEVGNALKLNLANETFDIIICSEVLEHLHHPELCISEIFRVLKPGGLCIITTPNKDNTIIKIARVMRLIRFGNQSRQRWQRKKQSYNFNYHFCNISAEATDHISVKNISAWVAIFKEYGFIIEKVMRGALFFSGYKYDDNRAFFALSILCEILIDRLPFCQNLSEDLIISLRKTKNFLNKKR